MASHNRKTALFTLVLLVFLLNGCKTTPNVPPIQITQTTPPPATPAEALVKPQPGEKTLSVIASFYPLAEFSKQVGGDWVEVKNIVPAGAEPHDYEPTPQDLKNLEVADLLVVNGAGLEPWVNRIQDDLIKKGIGIVTMSEHVKVLLSSPEEIMGSTNPEVTETEKKSDSKIDTSVKQPPAPITDVISTSQPGVPDPHFWLNPKNSILEVGVIRDELIKHDPKHKAVYEYNAKNYTEKLKKLDTDYRTGLLNCTSHDLVTTHTAFGYMSAEYGLKQISITGLSPDEDPTPQKLGEIATKAKEKGVKYIFFETLISPKLAQTIAEEIGAGTLVLNPLEGLTDEEIKDGKNYVSVMEENLQDLRFALNCK